MDFGHLSIALKSFKTTQQGPLQGSVTPVEGTTQLVPSQNVAPSCGQQDYGVAAEITLARMRKVVLELHFQYRYSNLSSVQTACFFCKGEI